MKHCMHCNKQLRHVFIDLNYSPVSNAMLNEDDLDKRENYFPLTVYVCGSCFLVQHDESKKAVEIFDETYTYFSSYSSTWLTHARNYVEMMMDRFDYDSDSLIMEIASNDGYLLKNFLKYNIPVLGIEPTANTAKVAEELGVESIVEFFNADLVENRLLKDGLQPDLIIGNNVLAHVPDINDFVFSMKKVLKPKGVITMEFPHLSNLIKEVQFDTIYHEHFTYLSLYTVNKIFRSHGLKIFDCERLKTHGGSLRIFATHENNAEEKIKAGFKEVLAQEIEEGVDQLSYYLNFQDAVLKIKYQALQFLIGEKLKGKRMAAYGAASKGNTFLNYCGIHGTDLIEFVVDASPYKQGKYLPGSHIPVVVEDRIKQERPDYILILPWNLKKEIQEKLSYVRQWGAKFVLFIPELSIF